VSSTRFSDDAELSEHARAQQALWGTDPDGWAEVAEPLNRPLFGAMLDATGVGAGTHLLDVGCGSGLALSLAVARGAVVAGIDVSPGLLDRAARRVPDAELRLGDLAELPYADASFDVVLGVNSFQFAADPVAALAGAARVVQPQGVVAASLFAEPERCESTAIHLALSALSPPVRQSEHQPYALSAPGGLERAMTEAGLVVDRSAEVRVDWDYADAAAAVRGLLSSGGGARAVQDSGRVAADAAVRAAVAPFTRPDGRIVMHNVFRYVVARRPQRPAPDPVLPAAR
jgi:SAM-dependent methyltransferase